MAYENVCYLIHCDDVVTGQASHYIGFAVNLSERVAKHRASKGAGFLKQANHKGISWRVVRVWRNGDREAEKALKALGGKNLCPICSPYYKVWRDYSENNARVA